MKKLKKCVLLLITAILILVMLYSRYNTTLAATHASFHTRMSTEFQVGETFVTEANCVAWDLWNTYCIEFGDSLGGRIEYKVKGKVEIRGADATFYDQYGNEMGETSALENNVMAAILTPNSYFPGGEPEGRPTDWDWTEGMFMTSYDVNVANNSYDKLSRPQLALYCYFPTWKNKNKELGVDIKWGYTASGINNNDLAVGSVALCEGVASKYSCSVDLYYWEATNSSKQNILAAFPMTPTTPPPTVQEPKTSVTVKKVWKEDSNNTYGNRTEVTVQLLADGDEIESQTLNSSNNWTYTFDDLPTGVTYSVNEISVPGYSTIIQETDDNYFTITNTLKTTDITVNKVWDDYSNREGKRPSSVTITLLCDAERYEDSDYVFAEAELTGDEDTWTYTFEDLPQYIDGEKVTYTIKEAEVPEEYISEITGNATDGFTITNTYIPGYIEITGTVWNDGYGGKSNDINGILDDDDTRLGGIKVTLKNADGTDFTTDGKTYSTETADDGTYTIKVNRDYNEDAYKLYEDYKTVEERLANAYIEFEYDGMKYTTVEPKKDSASSSNQSKAIEDEQQRNSLDVRYSRIEYSTSHPDNWTDKKVTATTKVKMPFNNYLDDNTSNDGEDKTIYKEQVTIEYCNGSQYAHTDIDTVWNDVITSKTNTGHTCSNCSTDNSVHETVQVEVGKISNVNLGLFEREQPEIAIFSDISKVEVEMNNQRYTYLYGVRGSNYNTDDKSQLQAKFQNKDTYTYRRPVNPADIAYAKTVSENIMKVYVTYEVKVGNLSTTLPITVHNIINYFDSEYTLQTSGWATTGTGNARFDKATYNGDLNIRVEPQRESSVIELRYEVSQNAIKGLLNNEPTLNNAVEIESYSTEYGMKTLYAEEGIGGRNGNDYAGYSYGEHPGNVTPDNRITINAQGRIEISNQENDEDIAPSFVLCLDAPTTIEGTVWDDVDSDITDNEVNGRLGNGYQDDTEKRVENVKVELYNPDGTLATLYDNYGNAKDSSAAIQYTDANGMYRLEGRITGEEYYIKYTYGDDTAELGHEATTIDGGTTKINARNYKSTIIKDTTVKNVLEKDYASFTDTDKKWALLHNDRYSIAVDNMEDRLAIGELDYTNFREGYTEPENMTSYTKPFIIQLEFDVTDETSHVKTDNSNPKEVPGDILDAVKPDETNVLDKFDFGISERAREDLFTEKTIDYFKVTLSNGQILAEGNPEEADTTNIPYTKTMGFRQEINSGAEARNALDKRLLVEIDTELIQGSQLEAHYQVTITNNNELDFDYGNYDDYKSEFEDTSKQAYDKYISQKTNVSYYYYGDKGSLEPMRAVIQVVDYLDQKLEYNTDTSKWIELQASAPISDATKNAIVTDEYEAFQVVEGGDTRISMSRKSSLTREMTVMKALVSKEENVYDNSVEIFEIDGKTARTIQEVAEGVQIEKTYKPDNHIPNGGTNEQDDDKVDIIVTPPTGLTSNIITYVITILVGLILVFVGIMVIKKKVLIK